MTAGMRYHSADVADVDRYIAADGWAMEQKLDGIRCIAHSPGTFTSHTGAPLKSGIRHHHQLARDMATAPLPVVLDGELLDTGHLWVFDLLSLGGHSTEHLPFAERRSLLNRLFDGWSPAMIHLVDSFTTAGGKAALWQRVLDTGAEGVVVKRLGAKYSAASRSRDVLKIKVTKTIDVVVIGFGSATDSAVLGLHDPSGRLVEVGKCSLIGKPEVAVGDVIEVQYLYVVDPAAPRLYQGRMMRRRPDKTAGECQWDQLDGASPQRRSSQHDDTDIATDLRHEARLPGADLDDRRQGLRLLHRSRRATPDVSTVPQASPARTQPSEPRRATRPLLRGDPP